MIHDDQYIILIIKIVFTEKYNYDKDLIVEKKYFK